MDIELIADTVPLETSFQTGAQNIVGLLKKISTLPEFLDGWAGLDEGLLSRSDAEFIEAAYNELGPDAKEIGTYFLVAGSPKANPSGPPEAPRYKIVVSFGKASLLPTQVKLTFPQSTATFDLAHRVLLILFEWGRIQHVKIGDPWYAMEDSPIDARRRGIGWAGWVPFPLLPDQAPEAEMVTPLGGAHLLWQAALGMMERLFLLNELKI